LVSLLGLFFNPEDGSDMVLSTDYVALYPKKTEFIILFFVYKFKFLSYILFLAKLIKPRYIKRLQNTYVYFRFHATVIFFIFYFISNSFVCFFTIFVHLTRCSNFILLRIVRLITFIKCGSVNIIPPRAQNFKV
jgi:hypothetical protein